MIVLPVEALEGVRVGTALLLGCHEPKERRERARMCKEPGPLVQRRSWQQILPSWTDPPARCLTDGRGATWAKRTIRLKR
jgi:hypothetical protein